MAAKQAKKLGKQDTKKAGATAPKLAQIPG